MFVSAWACSPLPRKPGVCSPAQAPSNTRLESMVFAWSEVKRIADLFPLSLSPSDMSPSWIHLCRCGCITTEQAERENLCDLLLVLQVLLVLWNICYFASGIKLLLVSCALIFGGVGLAGVFWAVVSLFNVNMRLYHLFWAAKI
ncbi:uncharacterized protein LOC120712254 isoform X4 [Panicum virgatum]|uniref:Uncharacterized protein n=1 Tax=Panicum virgatum TaxID=38727 RepID=A0A8T0RCV0_PANVG|nr:uncharacterized protein LOC120712254 isoform X4 [Panicum virgatum]KAG2583681.1 hypothetical protein PVAP13_6KG194200 [Panicum virgatum]